MIFYRGIINDNVIMYTYHSKVLFHCDAHHHLKHILSHLVSKGYPLEFVLVFMGVDDQ